MAFISNGAHLAGAPALFPSLQLGAASIGSLDPAIGILDGCESSYAPARGPLFFSKEGGGGSSNTLPGTPVLRIGSEANRTLDESKNAIGIEPNDNSLTIDKKLTNFIELKGGRFDAMAGSERIMVENIDYYQSTFETLYALLDDENPDIVVNAIRHMSEYMTASDMGYDICPGSQTTYRGRFLRKASEAWNRGNVAVGDRSTTTPLVELVRSLGTDRNALPEPSIRRLMNIALSEDTDNFMALVEAISSESTSDDEDRSTSAAFAFVISAMFLETPSRLNDLTLLYLVNLLWNSSMLRDNANYWIPMRAVADAADLIDDETMFKEYIKAVIDSNHYIDPGGAYAVPAIFHLAANLQDESHIKTVSDFIDSNERLKTRLKKFLDKILNDDSKFILAEQAIATKAAEVLKLKD